jgi:hypothetical protein
MELFRRRVSFLLVLLILVGCGQERAFAPPGRPYPVTLAQGVLVAPLPSPSSSSSSLSSGSSGGSGGSCNLSFGNCGSGSDALVGLAVVVAVVIVVAVVVCAVDAASYQPPSVVEWYCVNLSGEGVPLAVISISTTSQIYLDEQQHAALSQGLYTRAVLRPAVWEGTRGAPTQDVRVSLADGRVTITPVEQTP